MENPCENCIALARCKVRAKEKSPAMFIVWAGQTCPPYRNYVTGFNRSVILVDKANELGKLFGYQITTDSHGRFEIGKDE